jgi:Na+/H+-dicarboxylate symporter
LSHPLRFLHPRSLKHLTHTLDHLVKGRLCLKILIGMALGIGVGVLLGPSVGWVSEGTAEIAGRWLALPGRLFLAMIQMIVIPLVFSSVIRGLASSEDESQLRSMGLKVVVFFLVTTVVAIVIGMGMGLLIRPGEYIDTSLISRMADVDVPEQASGGGESLTPSISTLPQRLVAILPSNPIESMVQTEMLQVVVFAVFVGLALLSMAPDRSRPLLELLGSLQSVCMTVVKWAMRLAPVAVFGLMANLTSQVGLDVLLGLLVYVASVLAGLAVLFVVYMLILWIIGRRSPLFFIRHTYEALLLAFSTSSSAAVMPLSIRIADEKLGVRPSLSQFIVPLGATINMAGTALYQGGATIFLAQVYGVELSLASLALVVATAVSTSIGAPATPGVGIVILATILENAGIPASGVALLIGVDRILDMSRTSLNVTGDLTACVVMDRLIPERTSAAQQLDGESRQDRFGDETAGEPV